MEMPRQQQADHLRSVDAKPRMRWNRQLHELFVDAVSQLGGADKATPKSVMRIMAVPGLTLYHLKSHLQKYRLARTRRDRSDRDEYKEQGLSMLVCSADPVAASVAVDPQERAALDDEDITAPPHTTLKMQLEAERKLQEQIEVQRHLQLRIEAQRKYLQSVLRLAHETLAVIDVPATDAAAVAPTAHSELVSTVETERVTPTSSLSQDWQGQDSGGYWTESCLTSSIDAAETPDTKSRRQANGDAKDAAGSDSAEDDTDSNGASTSGEPPQPLDFDLNR